MTFVRVASKMSQTAGGNLLSPQSSSNSGKGVNDDSENDFAVGTLDSDQVRPTLDLMKSLVKVHGRFSLGHLFKPWGEGEGKNNSKVLCFHT